MALKRVLPASFAQPALKRARTADEASASGRQTTLRHWRVLPAFPWYGNGWLFKELQGEVRARCVPSARILLSMTCRLEWAHRLPHRPLYVDDDGEYKGPGYTLFRELVVEGRVPLLAMHAYASDLQEEDGLLAADHQQWEVVLWYLERAGPVDEYALCKRALYYKCPRRAIFNMLADVPGHTRIEFLAELRRKLLKYNKIEFWPSEYRHAMFPPSYSIEWFGRLYDWDFAGGGLPGLWPNMRSEWHAIRLANGNDTD